MLQLLKIGARLGCFFAVGITKQKILECSSRVIGCRDVLGPSACGSEPDVTNLILRVRRHRIVWKFLYHRRIGLESGVVRSLFFAGQTNVELCPRGVFAVGRGPNHGRKNFHRAIHRSGHRNTEHFQFFPGQIHFSDPELCFDRFEKMRTGRIICHHHPVRAGGHQVIMHLLHQHSCAKRGSGCQRIARMLADKLTIGTNGSLWIAFLFGLLSYFKKLGCIPVQLLFPGRDILCFFTWPKNDRTIGRLNQKQAQREQQKPWENSEFHRDWQGN